MAALPRNIPSGQRSNQMCQMMMSQTTIVKADGSA